jgi:predicted nucleic acid-binding protein
MIAYLDSNVLINAMGNDYFVATRALTVIEDPNRQLIMSDYVWLEVFPQLFVNKQQDQLLFAGKIWERSAIVESTPAIIAYAKEIAKNYGLSAMDALHIACAKSCNADEFITFEKPSKPFFNIPKEELRIISLY